MRRSPACAVVRRWSRPGSLPARDCISWRLRWSRVRGYAAYGCATTSISMVCLPQRMHLSRRRIQGFLRDWLGIELSTSTINQCIHEAGRAVEPIEEQLVEELQQASLTYADETPWKEWGQLLWLWVIITPTLCLYFIGYRSKEIGSGLWRGVCRLADERWLPGLPPLPAAATLLGAPATQGERTQTQPQRAGADLWAGHPRPAQRADDRDLPGARRPAGGPHSPLPRPVGRLPPVMRTASGFGP